MRKALFGVSDQWFLSRSDTNRAVHQQETARYAYRIYQNMVSHELVRMIIKQSYSDFSNFCIMTIN